MTNPFKLNSIFKLDSTDQLTEKLEKLKAYEQALKGRELQLREREQRLNEKELALKNYRKNILMAIREQIAESHSYEQSVKILEKYRDILQWVAGDVKEDIDEIMG